MTKLRWDRPTGSSPDPGRVIDVGAPLLTTPAGRKRLEEELALKKRREARAKRKAAKLRERQKQAAKRYWERAARKAAERRERILKEFENFNQERLARKLKRSRSQGLKPEGGIGSPRPSRDSEAKLGPSTGNPERCERAEGAQLAIALSEALRKRS